MHKFVIALKYAFPLTKKEKQNIHETKTMKYSIFSDVCCCHSVAILNFIAHMLLTVALLNFLITVCIHFIIVLFYFLSDSLLRLIASVTQLNLITFVGLAEMNCRNVQLLF